MASLVLGMEQGEDFPAYGVSYRTEVSGSRRYPSCQKPYELIEYQIEVVKLKIDGVLKRGK